MLARRRFYILGLLVAGLLGCSLLALRLPRPLESQYRQAHAQWSQRGVQHYELDVVWADGWQNGGARVEVRDCEVRSATDLATGKPLELRLWSSAQYFSSVDDLFTIVDKRIAPASDWRRYIGNLHPLLQRWFRPCVLPLTQVQYDPAYGFPALLEYNDGGCGGEFYTRSRVQITHFVALP